MTDVRKLHRNWSRSRDYRKAYESLQPEFDLARAMIRARTRAGLTQADLARKISTTQSTIARLESGRSLPATRTLQRYAEATGCRLVIRFDPL